jgi:hypothetical protein
MQRQCYQVNLKPWYFEYWMEIYDRGYKGFVTFNLRKEQKDHKFVNSNIYSYSW